MSILPYRIFTALIMSVTLAGMGKLALAEEIELDSIVAIVNDDIILASDFINERATLIRQNPPNLPTGTELDRIVIERLISQTLQLQAAEKSNIRIEDSNLQRALEDMARNNKMTITQMREALSRDGINFLEFRENIRKDMIISTLTRRQIESNLRVSDSEVEELLTTESAGPVEHRYHLDHILVQVPQDAGTTQVNSALLIARQISTDARDGVPFSSLLQAQHRNGISAIEGGMLDPMSLAQMPRVFATQVEGMQIGDITEPLRSPAGFHVLNLVSRDSTDKTIPKRVRARHILASTRTGTLTAQEAKERIDRIYNRLSEGADFAALARELSDDSASAVNGGDLGWFGHGEMVPRFEQIAFSSTPNQTSEPFFTEFGWHIMQVTDQEIDDNPRGNMENKARKQLHRKKAEEKYQIWVKQLRNQSYVELRGFAKNFQ